MLLSESSSLSRTGAGDQGYNSTCPRLLSLFHPPSFKGSPSLGLLFKFSETGELTIGTWVAGASVHFLLTVGAGEVGGAFTDIVGFLIALAARSPIEARRVGTAQGAVFTV